MLQPPRNVGGQGVARLLNPRSRRALRHLNPQLHRAGRRQHDRGSQRLRVHFLLSGTQLDHVSQPTVVEAGPWDRVFCSAECECKRSGSAPGWRVLELVCLLHLLTARHRGPRDAWRPCGRLSTHTGRALTLDHHEESCPPKH